MSQLTLERSHDGLAFQWKIWSLTVGLSRFKEGSSGTSAELTARAHIDGQERTLTQGTLNLCSLRTREQFANRLKKLYPSADWDTVMETVCVRGLQEHRQGEPAVELKGDVSFIGESFVLNPILYERHPTLFYGPGDSGKSFLCLYMALLLSTGGSQNGLCASDWTVLWLDWELASEETDMRVAMLKNGHPEFKQQSLTYRRLYRLLADCLTEIQATIHEHQVDILVIDSVALAAGAELERAETAIRFFGALRQLGLPALLIGHTAKSSEEKTPFGSVFFFNLARSVWEVKKVQEPECGEYMLGLYHKKNNLGPRRKPLGFKVTIQDATCTVRSCDLSEDPELSRGLPVPDQIEHLLKQGSALTPTVIADTLNLKLDTVRRDLRRYKGRRSVQLVADGAKESSWACL